MNRLNKTCLRSASACFVALLLAGSCFAISLAPQTVATLRPASIEYGARQSARVLLNEFYAIKWAMTPRSYSQARDLPEKRNDETTVNALLMIFTAALAIVAFLQLITFIWQIRTTRSTAEKELRAYVYPSSAKRFRSNGVMKVQITLVNSGKTPAHNCTNWLMEAYPPENEPYGFFKPEGQNPRDASNYVLGPGNDIDMLFDAVVPPAEIQRYITNGIRSLYVHGEIQYTDVFGKQQLSKFRFVSVGSNFDAGLFSLCSDGNEAT